MKESRHFMMFSPLQLNVVTSGKLVEELVKTVQLPLDTNITRLLHAFLIFAFR